MSNFKGTWQYARHTALGDEVVENPSAITISDDNDGNPASVTVNLMDQPGPEVLPVEIPKTTHDISFKKSDDKTYTRGRLVILSANTPAAIMIGSIAKGSGPLPDEDSQGYGEIVDKDIDVFIAVKTS